MTHGEAFVPCFVYKFSVHVVADDVYTMFTGDEGRRIQAFLVQDASGRVVGACQDDRLGPPGHGSLKLFLSQLKGIRLGIDQDRARAAEARDGFVQDEGGRGNDDLVPRVQKPHHRHEQSLGCARCDDDIVRIVGQTSPDAIARDAFAQERMAVVRRIVRHARIQIFLHA